MNRVFALALLALTPCVSHAMILEVHGSEPSPSVFVSEPKMKILGRGILDRKTGDALALTCTTDDCSTFRFAFFNHAEQSVTLIGPTFKMPQAPSEKLRSKSLKVKLKEYFSAYRTPELNERIERTRNFTIMALAMGTLLVMFYTSPAALLDQDALLPLIALGATFLTVNLETLGVLRAIQGDGGYETQLFDQNDWNWLEKPSTIGHNRFNIIRGVIEHGNSTEEVRDRIRRQIRRLEKRGVIF